MRYSLHLYGSKASFRFFLNPLCPWKAKGREPRATGRICYVVSWCFNLELLSRLHSVLLHLKAAIDLPGSDGKGIYLLNRIVPISYRSACLRGRRLERNCTLFTQAPGLHP